MQGIFLKPITPILKNIVRHKWSIFTRKLSWPIRMQTSPFFVNCERNKKGSSEILVETYTLVVGIQLWQREDYLRAGTLWVCNAQPHKVWNTPNYKILQNKQYLAQQDHWEFCTIFGPQIMKGIVQKMGFCI